MSDYISRKEFISRLSEETVYSDWKKIKHIVEAGRRKGDWLEGIYDAILICKGMPSAPIYPQYPLSCKTCKYRIINKNYEKKGVFKDLKAACDLDTGDPFELGRRAEIDDWFCADWEAKEEK